MNSVKIIFVCVCVCVRARIFFVIEKIVDYFQCPHISSADMSGQQSSAIYKNVSAGIADAGPRSLTLHKRQFNHQTATLLEKNLKKRNCQQKNQATHTNQPRAQQKIK